MKNRKKKISITLDREIYDFLCGFDNKSKYIEYLVYKNFKESNILKKEVII
jgi:hypothetical protein